MLTHTHTESPGESGSSNLTAKENHAVGPRQRERPKHHEATQPPNQATTQPVAHRWTNRPCPSPCG